MKTSALIKNCAIMATMLASIGMAQAMPVFVGSWEVGSGMTWSQQPTPPTLSGQGAAALLFGGSALDYFISSVGSNPLNINHSAWVDHYGIGIRLETESFVADINGNGLYDTRNDSSAYIHDNDPACMNRYGNPGAACSGQQYVNYAFRVGQPANVPEPASIALTGLGLLGLAAVRRAKK